MKSIIILTFLMIFSISGCKNEMDLIVNDQSFDLRSKEIKYFPDQKASILLDSVLNDSRCPNGAMCVWAGNAEVRLIYSRDNINTTFSLNTLSTFRTDTLLDGYRIKLLKLDPYPQAGIPIKQSDYKAEIKITLGNMPD